MHPLINFFESLTFEKNFPNNFYFKNEEIHIAKSNSTYLFYFAQYSSVLNASISRNNLCREIFLTSEDNAHLKLNFNNILSNYFDLKLNNKSIDLLQSHFNSDYLETFSLQFENLLINFPGLNYMYLSLQLDYEEFNLNNSVHKIKI